jgi:hypothetical protein
MQPRWSAPKEGDNVTVSSDPDQVTAILYRRLATSLMSREAQQRSMHRKAEVHDFLEMWQGSQNLWAPEMESHAQNKQFSVVGHISDTEETVKASFLNAQQDGGDVVTLCGRSPVQATLSAKNRP